MMKSLLKCVLSLRASLAYFSCNIAIFASASGALRSPDRIYGGALLLDLSGGLPSLRLLILDAQLAKPAYAPELT